MIPGNAATLNFYYWVESYEIPENCGYDHAYVRWGTTTLQTFDLCETYNTNQWVLGQIDLTAIRGQVGELIFEVVNDDVDHSNFFLDTPYLRRPAGAKPDSCLPDRVVPG